MSHLGPAPAVDRLVVVADDAERAMRPHERLDERELRCRWCPGTRRSARDRTARWWRASTSGNSSNRRCVSSSKSSKSTAAAALDRLLVAAISGGRQHVEIVFDEVARPLRRDARRLPAADALDQVARAQSLIAHANLAQSRAGRRLLVAAIVNGEVERIAEMRGLLPAEFARRASERW